MLAIKYYKTKKIHVQRYQSSVPFTVRTAVLVTIHTDKVQKNSKNCAYFLFVSFIVWAVLKNENSDPTARIILHG